MYEMPTMVTSSPGLSDARLAEGDVVALLRHRPLLEVQHAVLDEHHRVVVADGGDQAALGVVRRGRRHDLAARECA